MPGTQITDITFIPESAYIEYDWRGNLLFTHYHGCARLDESADGSQVTTSTQTAFISCLSYSKY